MPTPLVPVPIRCTYRDPDGTLSSDGQVIARAVGRSRVPVSSTVVSGDTGWALTNGALPPSAQLMAPPTGTLYYRITETIEGVVASYPIPVTAADATNGLDLATFQTGTDLSVSYQAIPGAQGPAGEVSTAQLNAALAAVAPGLAEAGTLPRNDIVTGGTAIAGLAGKTNRYAFPTTAPTGQQQMPAATDGAVIAFQVTASSAYPLTLAAAGSDVFGDGSATTLTLQPGDFYLARAQSVSGVLRWRRLSAPLLFEIDNRYDPRYGPITSTHLTAWALAQAFQFTANPIPRDANGAVTTSAIRWPDGATGTFTTTTASAAFPGAIDAWQATYVPATGPTRTVTQPAVTRDGVGSVITQPAITITSS